MSVVALDLALAGHSAASCLHSLELGSHLCLHTHGLPQAKLEDSQALARFLTTYLRRDGQDSETVTTKPVTAANLQVGRPGSRFVGIAPAPCGWDPEGAAPEGLRGLMVHGPSVARREPSSLPPSLTLAGTPRSGEHNRGADRR